MWVAFCYPAVLKYRFKRSFWFDTVQVITNKTEWKFWYLQFQLRRTVNTGMHSQLQLLFLLNTPASMSVILLTCVEITVTWVWVSYYVPALIVLTVCTWKMRTLCWYIMYIFRRYKNSQLDSFNYSVDNADLTGYSIVYPISPTLP